MLSRPAQAAALLALIAVLATACADAIPVAPNGADDAPAETVADPDCGWLRWSETATTVADWFTAHPDIDALHSWDIVTQRFEPLSRAERRRDPTKRPQAGAVIWRSGGGAPPPQTFTAADAKQVMQLRAGLNLLPWAGGAESTITLTEALRWLGPNLVSITRWDAAENVCRRGWGSPDGESDAVPGPGDFLALELREDATWYQAWAQPQLFMVAGNVGAEAYAELRSETVSVAGYIAATYALAVRPPAVFLTTSRDDAERAFGPLLDAELPADWWPEGACGFANDQVIVLRVGCGNPIAFAHEYVHLLQSHLVHGATQTIVPREPQWLLEGAAVYIAARYRDAAGHRRYEHSRARFLEDASADGGSTGLTELETVEQWRSADPTTAYAISFLAAERLAALAGDDALFEFYRELRRYAGHRPRAFHAAFGMALAEFYAEFARETAATAAFEPPRQYRIRGALVDPSGAPVEGMRVYAYPWRGGSGLFGLTDAEGAFEIAVPAGAWRLSVHSGSRCTVFGEYRSDGALGAWGDAARLNTGPDASPDVRITLPTEVDRLRGRSTCREPDSDGWVRGTVRDPDGRGVADIEISTCDLEGVIGCARAVTNADGAYALDAPPGEYRLAVGPTADPCLIWGARGAQGQLVDSRSAAALTIGETRLRGIDIRLPAAPEDLPTIGRCR